MSCDDDDSIRPRPIGSRTTLGSTTALRSLVRSLLFDPQHVDDVVQEVWVAALRNAPKNPENVRAWVTTVVKRFIHREQRTQRARTERERVTAKIEALPSVAEFAEQESTRRMVVDALLALDEPYRSVLQQRFFDEKPVREIAREMQVPRETVKTRIKRGLSKLRAKLDHVHDGDRQTWQLALIPLGVRPSRIGASLVAAASAWSYRSVFAFAAAAGTLVLGLFALAMAISGDASREATNTAVAKQPEFPEARSSRAASDLSTSRRSSNDTETKDVANTEPFLGVRVVGRAVDSLDNPVEGAKFVLTVEPTRAGSLPSNTRLSWSEITRYTNADGRFECEGDVARGYVYRIIADAAGYCPMTYPLPDVADGKTIDLGKVVFVRGGSIEGSMVDRHGKPVDRGWSIDLYWVGNRLPSNGFPKPRKLSSADMVNGTFSFPNLTPGVWRLDIAFAGRPPEMYKTYSVRAREVETFGFRYLGIPAHEEIVIHFTVDGRDRFGSFFPPSTAYRAIGQDDCEYEAEYSRAELRDWIRFHVPPRQRYRIELNDERFEPWTRDGVEPGHKIEAVLVPNSAVELHVEDPTGKPCENYALSVRVLDLGRTFRLPIGRQYVPLTELGAPKRDGIFVLPRCAAGGYMFYVQADGAATAAVRVDGLEPGERRTVKVKLTRVAQLAGRVVSDDASFDISQCQVGLFRELDDRLPRMIRPVFTGWPKYELAGEAQKWMQPDAAGRFEFGDLSEGVYRIIAFPRGESSGVLSKPIHVTADVKSEEVVLTMPERAVLEGTIVAPNGFSFEGLRVEARIGREVKPIDEWSWIPSQYPRIAGRDYIEFRKPSRRPDLTLRTTVKADGTFRFGSLGAAEIELFLLPAVERRHRSTGPRMANGWYLGKVTSTGVGTVRRRFEAHDRLPRLIDLRVRTPNAPAAGAKVRVFGEGDRQVPEASGVVDPDGYVRGLRLSPGTKHLQLEGRERVWTYDAEHPLEIDARDGAEYAVFLPLSEHWITFVDQIGEVRPDHPVYLQQLHPTRRKFRPRIMFSERDGRLKLELAAGRYFVRSATLKAGNPFVEGDIPDNDILVWTENGPKEPEFVLREN